jgi:micrococcal nuclease
MRIDRRLVVAIALLAAAVVVLAAARQRGPHGCRSAPAEWSVVDHVADGDTIVLCDGATVRLAQIDTPEVFFGEECFGEEASAETKRLLRPGAPVRAVADPALDDVDGFGRLLRYVVREDGLDVNGTLVADGAATPYFYEGARGDHADELLGAAERARAAGRGLWGACPGTELNVGAGVSTGPPR